MFPHFNFYHRKSFKHSIDLTWVSLTVTDCSAEFWCLEVRLGTLYMRGLCAQSGTQTPARLLCLLRQLDVLEREGFVLIIWLVFLYGKMPSFTRAADLNFFFKCTMLSSLSYQVQVIKNPAYRQHFNSVSFLFMFSFWTWHLGLVPLSGSEDTNLYHLEESFIDLSLGCHSVGGDQPVVLILFHFILLL